MGELAYYTPTTNMGSQVQSIITSADFALDADYFGKVDGDEPFEVPSEVLSRPQYIFAYHIAVLYRTQPQLEELAKRFRVSTQSIWLWRRMGVPKARKKPLQIILDEPDELLRLATNVTVDDLIRPYGEGLIDPADQEPNYEWLDLLSKIETGQIEGMSREDIPELCGPRQKNRSTPYYWGWDTGGVPAMLKHHVWSTLVEYGVHKHYKMNEAQFEDYCERTFGLPFSLREARLPE